MTDSAFEPDLYLERVKISGTVRPDSDGLEALHRSQIQTIPFENFDILLGRGITLEPGALFDKLLRRARGGYCFELNGLFLAALKAFGFTARALLARVHLSGSPGGRGHQLSLVKCRERQWICDVGFGAPHMPAPLLLEMNRPVTTDGLTHRLVAFESFGTMLQIRPENDQWQNLYSFDLEYVGPADIACGNYYTSTHPDCFFTFDRVAALPNSRGYVSLHNRKLKKVIDGQVRVETLNEGQAYLEALKAHFGIELDAPYQDLAPMPASSISGNITLD